MAVNPLQTERDLIRKQEYVIKQQDAALADIEKGVGRLKNRVRARNYVTATCKLSSSGIVD